VALVLESMAEAEQEVSVGFGLLVVFKKGRSE
jgi:hypothetical protein